MMAANPKDPSSVSALPLPLGPILFLVARWRKGKTRCANCNGRLQEHVCVGRWTHVCPSAAKLFYEAEKMYPNLQWPWNIVPEEPSPAE